MKPITLAEIEQRIRELARSIDAPDWILPTYGHSEDGARPHIEVEETGRMHYIVVERGQEIERITLVDLDDLLYRVFQSVTFSLACQFELNHREPKQDFRRIMFAKQVDLLGKLSPKWADRDAERHAEILKNHPFRDDPIQ